MMYWIDETIAQENALTGTTKEKIYKCDGGII
jgi:hypothetical protein